MLNPSTVMIGKRLRTIRVHKDLKQEHVAREAGISQSTLSRIERGCTEPTFIVVRDLVRILGCSFEDLIEGPKAADRRMIAGN